MQPKASSVRDYLAAIPDDRRAELAAVRKVILDNLDKDLEEGMQCGMIGYYVPHRVFPDGYHCDPRLPLPYAGLAAQKNHLSLHLMCVYGSTDLRAWFEREWKKTGKKLDMGKACIRFKRADDLALDIIAATLKRVSAAKYVEVYRAHRAVAPNARPQKASRPAPRPTGKKKSRATSTAARASRTGR